MENKLHTPIGVRDILPAECAVKNEIIGRIKKIFASFGYMAVESPTFEFQEVFAKDTNGQDESKTLMQMYKFFDRDGSILSLRSDMTPPIARIAATAYGNSTVPLRLAYYGNAFRYNENYQGKLREYSQAGVELIGVDNSDADAEVLSLAVKSLLAAGLKEFKINIGQVQFFKGILEETGLNKKDCNTLKEMIAKRDYVGVEALIERRNVEKDIKKLFIELPKLVGGEKVIEYAAALTKSKKALIALEKLRDLYSVLKNYSIENYISFDLGMVNRLNYYTGIIFRGYTYGVGYSVVDGGRYDNLVEEFGVSKPAVGFGIRINEVMSAMESQGISVPFKKIDAIIAYKALGRKSALEVADIYRNKNYYIENSLIGDDFEENIAYAKQRGIGHLLYFIDDTNLKVVSLNDEMGGFTVDVKKNELLFPEKEVK